MGGVARAFRFDPALGRPHPQVQLGERAFQRLQGVGRAVLGRIKDAPRPGPSVPSRRRDRRPFRPPPSVRAGSLTPRRWRSSISYSRPDRAPNAVSTLAKPLLRHRAGVAFEGAQAAMALAQFLGDVVDAAGVALGFDVLAVQPAHQAGDGLIHALNGGGRAALGGFEPRGDHVDGGADAMTVRFGKIIGVVQPAAAAAGAHSCRRRRRDAAGWRSPRPRLP